MIILLIKIFLLSHLITNFQPLQWFLEAIKDYFNKNIISKLLYNLLIEAISCIKCMSFWTGLIIGGFWIACLSTFIAYLYSNLLQPHIEKIRLL
jgi:hypothetical protein